VDSSTGRYLPGKYGRCDREVNCQYHYSPYDDSFANEHFKKDNAWKRPVKQAPPKPPKYIPRKLFKKSMVGYKNNSFVRFLLSIFDKKTISQLIKKYYIGTSGQLEGGCIFYQVDIENNIRRGKIMTYDSTGHRQRFSSVHSQLGWSDRLPEYRFFGEHLLNGPTKPVAIVESEKTAIIASAYFPDFTWLATGSKSMLKKEYARSLADRPVTLFPDIGAYNGWQDNDLTEICNVTVSDFLEQRAGPEEKRGGYDLADYLIQLDLAEFLGREGHAPGREYRLKAKYESGKNALFDVKLNNAGYPAGWDEVTLADRTPEFSGATKAALGDCDNNFERLQIKDSKVGLLHKLFGAVPKAHDAIQLK
jgi:hypothetical protein